VVIEQLMLVPGIEPLIPVPQSRIDATGGRAVFLDRIPLDLGMKGSAEGVVLVLECCEDLWTASFRTLTFSGDIARAVSRD
jgi:hypothetical protein